MEVGDNLHADSAAAADTGCPCAGCEQAWRQSWALEKIEAAERELGPLAYGMQVDLLQDQAVDSLCFELNRDAAAELVTAAQGLQRRLARYAAEHAVLQAEDEVVRLWKVVREKRRHEKEGASYEHPLCQGAPDYDGGEDRPHGSIDFPGVI